MDLAKRKLIQASLFGAAGLGLRSLATGLPIGLLSQLVNPRVARADTTDDTADGAVPACIKSQYLILFNSGSGDPLNANVPGTYDDPDVYHSLDPRMAKTAMTVGGKQTYGAAAWAGLTPEILNRTAFFHHGTYTNAHGDVAKVNRIMGSLQRQEMLVSFISKTLTSCLGPGGALGVGGTVQPSPVCLANDLITYDGAVIPPLNPQNLQAVLTGPGSPLLQNLQALRDKDLDSLHDLFRQSGTASQIALLDQYAASQSQVRNINQQILSDLSNITGNSRTDYNIAAAVLIRLNVSPTLVMPLNFGGDNHGDTGLAGEAEQTSQSIGQIEDLYGRLKNYGLQDNVTMMFQNVFGRTLNTASHSGTIDGRNHNSDHHCTVVIGSTINSGVYGGIQLNSSSTDFQATTINSTTGAGGPNGDISYVDTLASVAKTVSAAVGVPQAVYDFQITNGIHIPAALKST
jgi:hypothetical protein